MKLLVNSVDATLLSAPSLSLYEFNDSGQTKAEFAAHLQAAFNYVAKDLIEAAFGADTDGQLPVEIPNSGQ